MRRRKNGEGSYGTKKVHGVVYKYYRSPDREWTVYAKTAKELEEKKKARENEMMVKKTVTNQIFTISNLCDKWLEAIHSSISPNTYDSYEEIINIRIKRYKDFDIGNILAANITLKQIQLYIDSLKSNYAKATIDKTFVVLKQAIEYGMDNGYISSEIDFKKIKRPNEIEVNNKKKEIQFTTLEDVEILYNEINKTKDNGTPIYGNGARVLGFIMYSGLRIGEVIALKWKHVSKDYSEIRVRQSNRRIIKRNENGNAIMKDGSKVYMNFQKGTKTPSGERIVPLPSRGTEFLNYFDQQFPDHKPEDHVFLSKNNQLFDRRNLEKTLQRLLDNSDCSNKEYTPHSLRHGYGSILLSQGVDIKTVSLLLGHKDISTTYNIYIHVLAEDKKKAVVNVFDKQTPAEI